MFMSGPILHFFDVADLGGEHFEQRLNGAVGKRLLFQRRFSI